MHYSRKSRGNDLQYTFHLTEAEVFSRLKDEDCEFMEVRTSSLSARQDIALSDEDVERAMEKFGQVRREKGIKNEGTGLGLPLTKGLVEAHGGKMKIESIVGQGTTVTVLIPSNRIVTQIDQVPISMSPSG